MIRYIFTHSGDHIFFSSIPHQAIFYDGDDHFRVKNIPDNNKSRLMLRDLGLELYNSVDSIKSTARRSLADTRSNVV